MTFGLLFGIGWFGFGARRDFFARWFDLGILTVGFSPAHARSDFIRIYNALRRLAESLRKEGE